MPFQVEDVQDVDDRECQGGVVDAYLVSKATHSGSHRLLKDIESWTKSAFRRRRGRVEESTH